MLVLTLSCDDAVQVGNARLIVTMISRNRIKLAFDAPRDVPIVREGAKNHLPAVSHQPLSLVVLCDDRTEHESLYANGRFVVTAPTIFANTISVLASGPKRTLPPKAMRPELGPGRTPP